MAKVKSFFTYFIILALLVIIGVLCYLGNYYFRIDNNIAFSFNNSIYAPGENIGITITNNGEEIMYLCNPSNCASFQHAPMVVEQFENNQWQHAREQCAYVEYNDTCKYIVKDEMQCIEILPTQNCSISNYPLAAIGAYRLSFSQHGYSSKVVSPSFIVSDF